MASGRYEIVKKSDGEYTFSLYGAGSRPIALGGSYKTVALAKKGIASLRINSSAPVTDLSAPEADGGAGRPRFPRIEIRTEEDGYNFTVFAKNGNIIARGEGYGTRSRCLETVASLKYIAFSAETYVL